MSAVLRKLAPPSLPPATLQAPTLTVARGVPRRVSWVRRRDVKKSADLRSWRNWRIMALAVPVITGATAIVNLSVPPIFVLTLLALGSLATLPAKRLGLLVHKLRHRSLLRDLTAGAIVSFPMALFGLAMSFWAEAGGISWASAISALIAITLIASLLKRRRPVTLVATYVPCWAAVAMAHPA